MLPVISCIYFPDANSMWDVVDNFDMDIVKVMYNIPLCRFYVRMEAQQPIENMRVTS